MPHWSSLIALGALRAVAVLVGVNRFPRWGYIQDNREESQRPSDRTNRAGGRPRRNRLTAPPQAFAFVAPR
jgi:hypothetical protein